MFYEILARLHSYQGANLLTYSSEQVLPLGSVVRIHVRNRPALGIVMSKVTKPNFATKQIDEAVDLPALPNQSLQLINWLRDYYPTPLGLLAQLFLPANLPQKIKLPERQVTTEKSSKLPPLTSDQKNALKKILPLKTSTIILAGLTGSGKTRVYGDLASQQLQNGRSVILLTPEISLTPQLVQTIQTALPNYSVIVMHSTLTDAQRRVVWLQALTTTQPLVVIGPRSALFVPLKNLGLIVIDEFHEPAYKQEQAPHYQTVRVAGQLARFHKGQLLLGSATPPIAEYYLAEAKKAPIISMTQLATGQPADLETKVVDLRDKTQLTRDNHLSNELIKAVEQALSRQEQALIFLNRRGTARLVLCENCGWQALCPRCDLPLTYHGDSHQMLCHTCGYHSDTPLQCPMCSSSELLFKSIGTKSLMESLSKLFPKARLQRFDSDSTKDERFEKHYEAVKAGEVDIIVGTQLLAKGLDLPFLSVVGVVAADSSLYLPDYTAEERTYQLLSQVIGRVGRGHRKSTAVIQTYRPDGPAIQAALSKDWQAFYKEQLKEREAFLFPPYVFLMKLSIKRAGSRSAQVAAETMANELRKLKKPVQIIGPSPAFYEKVAGKYEWQIVVKARNRQHLLELITHLPSNVIYDLDPANLL